MSIEIWDFKNIRKRRAETVKATTNLNELAYRHLSLCLRNQRNQQVITTT